ncbi:MAG: hypothetical protein RLZZ517_72 [Candidatus Parcubacteria bacterium]|jgi:Zn finger protein HypA/HybF involved in hydrogenase expression
MSSLSFCECNKCGFLVKNSFGFPYHKNKENNEITFLTIPVGTEVQNSGTITGYKHSLYCKKCRDYKDLFFDTDQREKPFVCPTCNEPGNFLNPQDTCPHCNDGVMEINGSLQVLF